MQGKEVKMVLEGIKMVVHGRLKPLWPVIVVTVSQVVRLPIDDVVPLLVAEDEVYGSFEIALKGRVWEPL